jgi:serine/threonine protein phosphatase PrpC
VTASVEAVGQVVAAAVSHVGRVRPHNEDSHLVDTEKNVFIVADGMGGHAAGEVASAIAVERAHAAWTAMPLRRHMEAYASKGDPDARRALFRAVRDGVMNAHFDIVEQAKADEDKRGMGTTFTGFLLAGGDAVFAHAGDSRAYLVRDEIPIQLSEDHTVLARLRAAGADESDPAGAEGEAAGDPSERHRHRKWRGVLTNALGIGDVTRVATFAVPMYSGDRFVLTSDGVTEYVAEAELGRVVREAASPALAANRMVELALARGGGDNATAVVVKVLEAGETRVPREELERDAEAVARCPLFASLSPQERLRALRITTPREIKPARELLATTLGDRVAYIVLDGEVVLASGEHVGPSGLIYPEALIATRASAPPAAATAELTRLLVIRQNDFQELTDEESDLGVKLFAELARMMVKS